MEATSITIESTINAPIEKVWEYWTEPQHIMQWNNASDDWHTPSAQNDLRPGGSFLVRMAAKDESFSFDFGGTYEHVHENRYIAYTMGDGRRVTVSFDSDGDTTTVVETFDAENTNPLEMQRAGWQAILDNFKKYTERNASASNKVEAAKPKSPAKKAATKKKAAPAAKKKVAQPVAKKTAKKAPAKKKAATKKKAAKKVVKKAAPKKKAAAKKAAPKKTAKKAVKKAVLKKTAKKVVKKVVAKKPVKKVVKKAVKKVAPKKKAPTKKVVAKKVVAKKTVKNAAAKKAVKKVPAKKKSRR